MEQPPDRIDPMHDSLSASPLLLAPGADPEWADKRVELRYLVNWRVAIVYEEREQRLSFRGRAFDVSKGGFSLHSDFSLPVSDRVTVLLSIPPLNVGQPPKVIEVKSRVVYTVLSSEFGAFRTGVQFVDFKGDGREALSYHLSYRNPAPQPVRQD
ncbi:PilZ domain-containing protein [Chitiniphilus purpureus]|uniref:PilZ domain-containing protein n=1 Tax=Chitiniphilus purpureus TaxID=2981137 RepID=A0ABY6DKS6_9NEIS|nr:PilZ domain-containing protein [Chitiniphilus sp. CD1]UXY14949.1 PilZ domain-containing protein [Chitiniphilus sp. CD1]